MASQQSFKAGEAHGHAKAKADEWIESTKDTANAAREKAADTAQSAKDKVVDTAQSVRDKAADSAQSARETGQHDQEKAAGFLAQTGEQVMNMAQGAMDSVKNTLGVNNNDHSHKK